MYPQDGSPEHQPDVEKLVWPLPRHDGVPNQWQTVFLKQLTVSPNVSKAARAAGVSRRFTYWYKNTNTAFAEAWQDCIETALDDVEEYAIDRGKENDQMAMYLLDRHRYKKDGGRPDDDDTLSLGFEDEPPVAHIADTDDQVEGLE